MKVTRRQLGQACVVGISLMASACNLEDVSPAIPTGTSVPPPPPKPLSQVLQQMGYSLRVECHRSLGDGIVAINGQSGGYVITINGASFGEGQSGRINLLNWPVQPGQTVAVTRVSGTPVVTAGNHC